SSLRRQLLDLVSRLDLGGLNPLWISLSAGIGEEILFRGALQPILGIWWTSFIFTVAHFWSGQFQSMNWQKLIYAASVFVTGLLLGYVFSEIGLIAAMGPISLNTYPKRSEEHTSELQSRVDL